MKLNPTNKMLYFGIPCGIRAGRPSSGGLRDIMAKSRNLYHYNIRRIKKMSDSIRARKLLEASESGSIQLMKEMKIITGSKTSHHDLPDIVSGAAGEELIVEEFRKMYRDLYNSCDTDEGVASIKAKLQEMIGLNQSVQEADLITGRVVKEAA